MMKILDQSGDSNGQKLYRIVQSFTAPDHIKSASSEQIYAGDELPATCFADPAARQFPIHTKEAAWVSYAFLLNSHEELTKESFEQLDRRLKEAGELYGIRDELEAMQQEFDKQASLPDVGLLDEDFALAWEMPNGDKERRFPLRNAVEVKEAAAYLEKYRDDLPYKVRRQMAERILDKAADYSADIKHKRQFLEKQAGLGWCSAEDTSKLLQERSEQLGSLYPDISEQFSKSAAACLEDKANARDIGRLGKLACLISDIDRSYGLDRKYGAGVRRPEDVLFAITIKSATDYLDEHCSTTSGCIYKVADFARLPLDTVRTVFGDDMAAAVSDGDLLLSPTKLAEQAHALPKPDAELLDRLLAEVGVRPIGKEASAQSSWLDQETLKELAAQ